MTGPGGLCDGSEAAALPANSAMHRTVANARLFIVRTLSTAK